MPRYRDTLQKNLGRVALQVCETFGTPEQWEYLIEHANSKALEQERREHEVTKQQLQEALDSTMALEGENRSLRKMKHKNKELFKSIQSFKGMLQDAQ